MRERVTVAGKRILVTGGTTGIGRATVSMLAEQGALILTVGREQDPLDEIIAECGELPGAVYGLAADVSTREGIDAIFAAVDDQLAGIDMLVACAALGAQPVHEMEDDAWRYVVDTNLTGCLASARGALARMLPGAGGHLLFVGSVSTEIKAPGESVYAATKAGLQAFAETLRKEVAADHVKVSVIQPGSTSTDMQECSDADKREAIARDAMLHAEDVAEAILFALTRSPSADVVTLRIEPRMQKYA